ncbi:2,3-diaminopropionate biosynthesis protein SbnA [Paenibacillus lemnae]|uniref:N-(2-amino-2-carboxyethyl)-L-glutamate synthase n=1 Tax=Paenibacillus lemnae TaxID=1330551 RepID=A0A848M784_PAELE|nr:2,3-diaminopropionate biosynthesis protein SbnA [Paenibacillus lemnae]NMO96071.1 2,3-diaminopropionate biosynthesis protein SbnA [Paenibacillus lemnae]
MKLEGGIADTIGGTPLVRLSRIFYDEPFKVYAKLEGMNPGGSAKDRPALYLLREAIRRGEVTENSVIIESSSGNLAISLAQLCRSLGLRFICVVDPRTTEQHKRIIRSYHGEIELVSQPDPATGEFLPARISRVRELVAQIPNAYWTNQYGNLDNSLAHTEMTMKEIGDALGHIDYLFVGVSSCGTIRGCADYIKARKWNTKVIAVDAAGSVIFGGAKGARQFPGLGAALVPGLFRPDMADAVQYVSDRDCVEGCRLLIGKEAIMAGASSGGVITSILRMKGAIPQNAVCCAILPDRGERYLDTVYSDEWVQRVLGFNPRLQGEDS